MIGEQADKKAYNHAERESGRYSAKPFFAAAVRLAEITTVAMLMLISNRKAWYCFFILDDGGYSRACEYGSTAVDYLAWGLIVAAILLLLLQRGLMHEYVESWKSNRALLLFIGFAGLSLAWSIAPARSLHTVFILLAASIAGSALVRFFSRPQLLGILLWFLGLVALSSLAVVLLLPTAGITQIEFLAGTWRGLYWHKNYLGAVMAFGNALFLLSFWRANGDRRRLAVAVAGYLLTLFLVVMSKSATGLIDLVLLHGLILAYFAWLKWGRRLSQRSLMLLGGGAGLLAAAGLLNLGRLFSLVGRESGLTGRVPLWQYLLTEMVSKRPWFGYGLETLWRDTDFWRRTGDAVGWGITIVNAHNGYIDILLYLGVTGFALLLVLLAVAAVRAVRSAFQEPGWSELLPLLMLTYVLVTNITISYFIEFESWHWVLLVLVLFMCAKSPASRPAKAAT